MPLKYKVIKTDTQYYEYCNKLEALVFSPPKNMDVEDEIELLTVLIEKWDADHDTLEVDWDPVQLLRAIMKETNMKAKDIADLLQVSKGYVSEILNYKKGMSKEVIRKLANRFKVSQEALNKPYKLKTTKTVPRKRTTRRKKQLSRA
jgi:HTH-type transcriptional regulator / antitoxin HigA